MLCGELSVVELMDDGPAPGNHKSFLLVRPKATLLDNSLTLDETIEVIPRCQIGHPDS